MNKIKKLSHIQKNVRDMKISLKVIQPSIYGFSLSIEDGQKMWFLVIQSTYNNITVYSFNISYHEKSFLCIYADGQSDKIDHDLRQARGWIQIGDLESAPSQTLARSSNTYLSRYSFSRPLTTYSPPDSEQLSLIYYRAKSSQALWWLWVSFSSATPRGA